LALAGVVLAIVADLLIFRTRLLTRRVFWVSYAIIVSFQLLTNGVLTGFGIVRYSGAEIIGDSSPTQGPPPFIGDGRLVFAPVEDLLFGFALVVLTLVLWVFMAVFRTAGAGFGAAAAEPAAGDAGATPGRD
jgi:hypothetical protein